MTNLFESLLAVLLVVDVSKLTLESMGVVEPQII